MARVADTISFGAGTPLIAAHSGEIAYESSHVGVTSELFGNPSLKTASGERAITSGVLNNSKNLVRIGWSVHDARPVFRIVI